MAAGNCWKKFNRLSGSRPGGHVLRRALRNYQKNSRLSYQIRTINFASQKTFVLTVEEAFQKLKHYCSYQERCHKEVESKLYDIKCEKSKHGEVISLLIENNYLNEERFAYQFAGGKFRMKQWGKKKIIYELKGREVSDYCIRKAMKAIDESDYRATIEKLVTKKMSSLKGETFAMKRKKTVDYMQGKGFEAALVLQAIGDPPKKKIK